MYSMSKYNISLKCHLSIGIGIVCTQDLKYELWHFVGGANLAQNLRLPNHCHFYKDLSSDNLQSICTQCCHFRREVPIGLEDICTFVKWNYTFILQIFSSQFYSLSWKGCCGVIVMEEMEGIKVRGELYNWRWGRDWKAACGISAISEVEIQKKKLQCYGHFP